MRRLPVYILVDCSVSMKGEAIEAVKVGLDKLLSSLRRDPYALEGVYVSLIAYSNDADVLVTLTELSDFQLPEITLAESSNRNLGQAIELLCQRYDEEVRKTTTEQKGDWLPFVVMLTGGDPDDEDRIEQILPQFREYLFAKIIACVAGADKPTRILRSFTKDIFLLDTMNSHSFSRFWQWVSKITSTQSRSLEQLQEELPPPPPEFNPFYSVDNATVENAAIETVVKSEPPPVKKAENPVETLTKPSIDIFEAVKRNDLSTVKQWINIDANLIHAKDKLDDTPLHCAVWNNSVVDIVKYLISQGADVNAVAGGGLTPLHRTALNNQQNVEVLKYLITQGADVNAKSMSGFTSLHYAANNHNLGILQYLISQGADINAKNKYDETPLDFLSTEERKQILDNASKASNSPSPTLPLSNPSPQTLPPNSPSSTLFQRIKKFLFFPRSKSNPSPPTLPPNPSPLTPQPSIDIFEAIKQNDLSTVQQWINIDAKLVHTKNRSVGTPLHCAALNNPTVDICQYLISQGADVNAVDNAGCMPLHHATWNMDICQYLISQGADVNAADTNGGTPLHHTIWNNSSVEVMKYLISRGADVHAKNRYGKTPLDIANTEEKKQILRNASNANPPPSTLPPNPLLPPYPYLVVTTYFNVATIWDATTGQSLCHLMHPNQVLSASYSPNGKYILTECRDKLVRIWNAETGYLLHAIHARKEFANDPVPIDFSDTVSACFSTDSKCVWIKYSNGNEWLADVTTGKSAGMINKSHMSFISPSRQISHDGKFEIKPGRNHSTLICESNTGKVVCELKGHKNFVSSAAFSPIDNNHFMAIPIKETQIGCASMVVIFCVLGICVNVFPFIIGLVITSLIGIFTDIFVIKKSKSCPKNLSRYWKMLFGFSASFLVIFMYIIIGRSYIMNYDLYSAWIWFLFGIITGLSAILPFSVSHFERNHKSKP